MVRNRITPHDGEALDFATALGRLPRGVRKRILADAVEMTAKRMLVEHGMRETAHLYQEHAALALQLTGTHAMLRQITRHLPPGHEGAFTDSLGLALATQRAMHAQLQGQFHAVIAARGGSPKSRWEEFDDGLALAARVLSFGLIRK